MEETLRSNFHALKSAVEAVTYIQAVLGNEATPRFRRFSVGSAAEYNGPYHSAYLVDGQILCKLMTKIDASVMPSKTKAPKSTTALERLQLFVTGCTKYGVAADKLFKPEEIVKEENYLSLYTTVIVLAETASRKGYPACLDDVSSDYQFTREQIHLAAQLMSSASAKSAARIKKLTEPPKTSSPRRTGRILSLPDTELTSMPTTLLTAVERKELGTPTRTTFQLPDDDDDMEEEPDVSEDMRGLKETLEVHLETVQAVAHGRGARLAWLDEAWQIDSGEVQMGGQLGKGMFGAVYKAVYRNVEVAVKVVKPDGNVDEATVAELHDHMKREVTILKQLKHANVLQFIGSYAAADNALHILTEFMPNNHVRHLLDAQGKNLDWRIATKIAMDTANGLCYLHQNGIIHRDIKTENLLITTEWRTKICDFGFARALAAPNDAPPEQHTIAQTAPNVASRRARRMSYCGTEEWMAPELLLGMEYDKGVDVYSYGIVLLELATALKAEEEPLKRSPSRAFELAMEDIRPHVRSDVPADFISLAEDCACYEADHRPDFSDVVARMQKLQIMPANMATKLDTVIHILAWNIRRQRRKSSGTTPVGMAPAFTTAFTTATNDEAVSHDVEDMMDGLFAHEIAQSDGSTPNTPSAQRAA